MAYVKLIGFAPDLDPEQAGVMLSASNILPTSRGFKAAPAPASVGYPAFASACLGAALARRMDGSAKLFAGTAANLYEADGQGAWTTRGSGFTLGADDLWQFGQFGDVTLAAAKTETLQAADGGAFSAVSGAPKASCIDVTAGFVMLANTNEATYGDQTDRWWCSAIFDSADWSPAVATQCTTGRILDAPGAIVAVKALGDGFIAYKETALFAGQYVGSPVVWQWARIPGEFSILSPRSVASIGTAHVFAASGGFFIVRNGMAAPIGAEVREWFLSDLDWFNRAKVHAVFDSRDQNVWFFYPPRGAGGVCTRALVWNALSNRWGLVDATSEAVVVKLSEGVSYDMATDAAMTYGGTALDYGTAWFTAPKPLMALFGSDHALYNLTGAATSSSIETGNFGDDAAFSTCSGVRPRFHVAPTAATCTHMTDDEYGDAFADASTATLASARFDVLRSSRWHRFRFEFSGPMEMAGFSPEFSLDGVA